ncbi:hypothetical protein [Ornithinimicrobium cerasi]|uniref:Uncharacterized protein n=1 Tax=Ornithinimicrobium cerasi TaxID=2248773 RepID=A0A285VIK6_9MICO|nr:hypothetical protein [Ornithinimicrobium cerasi]SOC53944.1 hypothetical protein SAMN05421879_102278 [Ornithinimicrobium cerasi]
MSDHDGSDRDVLALLDRAAADTPPLHLDRHDVVARGRQLARRRHAAVSGGMSIAALALAGTVWLGLGGGGPLLGTTEITPAGVSWEADESSPVVLPDGLQLVGNVEPRTLTRTPSSSTATLVVDGVEETVEGRTLPGGVEVYVGEGATVAVWDHPRGASPEAVVVPQPQGAGGSTTVTVDGEELRYWVTEEAGYVPEDVLFHDEEQMWAAGGAVAQTAELRDGEVRLTAVSLPDHGLVGYLDGDSFSEVDTVTVAGVDRPWWRGGGHDLTMVARLPREAVLAREVLRDDPRGSVVRASEPRPTALVGPWSMVLFTSGWAPGGPDSSDLHHQVQWSSDGETWHDQPLDLDLRAAEMPSVPEGVVGPGEEVTLLGEVYRVALDAHGWPRLVEGDGRTFLTVSDETGPSAGGTVLWREHWWPWSERHAVHFSVGEDLPPVGQEEAEDPVRIWGPAGVVTLVAVPAGT